MPNGQRVSLVDMFEARETFKPGEVVRPGSFALPGITGIIVLHVTGAGPLNAWRIRLSQDERVILDIPRALDDRSLYAPITITHDRPLLVDAFSCAVSLYGVAKRPSL